jgi:hypothetical protein
MQSEVQVIEMNGRKKRKKLKLKRYHLKDAGTQIHSVGLSRQTVDEEGGENESKSHERLRQIIFIVTMILLIKSCFLLIYYHKQEKDIIDERMFFWFGDLFFFEPKIRKHAIVAQIVGMLCSLQTQLLYHRLWKSGRMRCTPSALLFQVFAGMISSKELGLRSKDVVKFMRR